MKKKVIFTGLFIAVLFFIFGGNDGEDYYKQGLAANKKRIINKPTNSLKNPAMPVMLMVVAHSEFHIKRARG